MTETWKIIRISEAVRSVVTELLGPWHRMKDELRNVEVGEDVRDAIIGRARRITGRVYGVRGEALAQHLWPPLLRGLPIRRSGADLHRVALLIGDAAVSPGSVPA
jgi:hypothetical protein